MSNESKFMQLAARLPAGRTLEEMAKRNEIFQDLDASRSGFLRKADIQIGLTKLLAEESNQKDIAEAISRAFTAAKSVHLNHHGSSGDRLDKSEFRLLLLHMKQSLELRAIFDEFEGYDPLYISEAEAAAALPLLNKWGLGMKEPAIAFGEIDPNNTGQVFFPEQNQSPPCIPGDPLIENCRDVRWREKPSIRVAARARLTAPRLAAQVPRADFVEWAIRHHAVGEVWRPAAPSPVQAPPPAPNHAKVPLHPRPPERTTHGSERAARCGVEKRRRIAPSPTAPSLRFLPHTIPPPPPPVSHLVSISLV